MRIPQLVVTLFFCINVINSQNITGKWKTIDDKTGQVKSVVNIFEKQNKIYGTIVKLINPKRKNPTCTQCSGAKKNKPILGMQIIDGLLKNNDTYENGTILNPENGKTYKCQLKLTENPNKLRVRGYIAFFYKTQYWERVN